MENIDVNSHLKPSDFFYRGTRKKIIARGANFSINGTGKIVYTHKEWK